MFDCLVNGSGTQGNVKVIRDEGIHDHEKNILSLKSKNID